MSEPNPIVTELLTGIWDDDLDAIEDALLMRINRREQPTFHQLGFGDIVRFSHKVDPRWLAGRKARVEGGRRAKGTLMVSLIEKESKMPVKYKRIFSVPLESVNRV